MGYKIMELNKFTSFIVGTILFGLSIITFVNGSFTFKGVYISGELAYLIGGIDLIFGSIFLYSSLRN